MQLKKGPDHCCPIHIHLNGGKPQNEYTTGYCCQRLDIEISHSCIVTASLLLYARFFCYHGRRTMYRDVQVVAPAHPGALRHPDVQSIIAGGRSR
jgi:hypothetical protein